LNEEEGKMKGANGDTNGKKKKELRLSWVGEIFATPNVGKNPKPPTTRKLLMAAPVTREEADKIVDFFHNKVGDILLFLNDTADPKLMMAMKFYFEHKQKTEGLGWMIEIVPERAYLILPERPKLMEIKATENGVALKEVEEAADGAVEGDTSWDHSGGD
jgi:hypothetical protein